MQHCDYLFAGTGLAALLTAKALADAGHFEGKTIIFLEADANKGNDRSWCFWHTQTLFPDLMHHQWEQAYVGYPGRESHFDLAPYSYQLVRSGGFYKKYRDALSSFVGVHFIQARINHWDEQTEQVIVHTNQGTIIAKKVFSSIYTPPEPKAREKYPLIHQHFVGSFVRTEQPIFNPTEVQFMDFGVPQKGNTRFMYVLPFSQHEALVEYTLFSDTLLDATEYEAAISEYLQQKEAGQVEVLEREQGNIPMTVYPFEQRNTQHVLHIGTAGGWTKASTGFTLRNSMRQAEKLAQAWHPHFDARTWKNQNRFRWYDRLLLEVLATENQRGSEVFCSMFTQGKPTLVLRFLDEQTTFWQDLQLIARCPTGPFVRALWRVLKKSLL